MARINLELIDPPDIFGWQVTEENLVDMLGTTAEADYKATLTAWKPTPTSSVSWAVIFMKTGYPNQTANVDQWVVLDNGLVYIFATAEEALAIYREKVG